RRPGRAGGALSPFSRRSAPVPLSAAKLRKKSRAGGRSPHIAAGTGLALPVSCKGIAPGASREGVRRAAKAACPHRAGSHEPAAQRRKLTIRTMTSEGLLLPGPSLGNGDGWQKVTRVRGYRRRAEDPSKPRVAGAAPQGPKGRNRQGPNGASADGGRT